MFQEIMCLLLSAHRSISPSVCLSVRPSVRPCLLPTFNERSPSLPAYYYITIFKIYCIVSRKIMWLCLFAYQSVCLSVCLPVCLSVWTKKRAKHKWIIYRKYIFGFLCLNKPQVATILLKLIPGKTWVLGSVSQSIHQSVLEARYLREET